MIWCRYQIRDHLYLECRCGKRIWALGSLQHWALHLRWKKGSTIQKRFESSRKSYLIHVPLSLHLPPLLPLLLPHSQVRQVSRRWQLRWRVLEERRRTQRSLKEMTAPTASASYLRRWELTLLTLNIVANTSPGAPSNSLWGHWEREGPTRSGQGGRGWTEEWQGSQVSRAFFFSFSFFCIFFFLLFPVADKSSLCLLFSWVQYLDQRGRSWRSVNRCGGTEQGRDHLWRQEGRILWRHLRSSGAWWDSNRL